MADNSHTNSFVHSYIQMNKLTKNIISDDKKTPKHIM